MKVDPGATLAAEAEEVAAALRGGPMIVKTITEITGLKDSRIRTALAFLLGAKRVTSSVEPVEGERRNFGYVYRLAEPAKSKALRVCSFCNEASTVVVATKSVAICSACVVMATARIAESRAKVASVVASG
jgi:hypothetical protein